ncbi:SLAP domain-containing protein [Lactobacillus crispatus]|uniref:SLAP domain-containing protein n=1 Tax=Lactobacillus crispatus TaxID=47770 RepID=UPI000B5D9580|nr:SLAP domain-containing protein [Lactobacillus crispatus]OXC25973.1 S-layer protein [Lactobacillus crispatus]OXC31338.1 S-layer protein [Lactobacillus crispatus]OXC38125.1 S-layer protein [Lactobacillus crispatus]OXC40549.1 S-layer protein [Lactobacillus crispatus]
MKKNLRIVSAAAALLAVAPVAAYGVSSVNAADSTATTTAKATDYTNINLGGSAVSSNENQVDVTPALTLNGKKGNIKASLTGSITASFGGKSFTANLTGTEQNNVTINGNAAKDELANVEAGDTVTVSVANVGFNFGSENKGKKVTFKSSNSNVTFASSNRDAQVSADGKTVTATLDQNGTVSGLTVVEKLVAYDATNTNDVVFYNIATGQPVTSGDAMVLADSNKQLNVAAILPAVNSNFTATQRVTLAQGNGNGTYSQDQINPVKINTTTTEIKDQLEKAGIKIDANGNFTAPHSFKVTVKATSDVNGKSKELPVTFTVANVADPVVPSQSKTIMHNAYYYKEDGTTRANNDKAKRYESVTVAMSTKKIGNKDFYEVIKDGKATGMYINADNIDGTKRTLKHNAYVYKTSKKRANKVVLKKGDTVVTYGGTYTFKNGKQYYKINNNTEKTYVKASNF